MAASNAASGNGAAPARMIVIGGSAGAIPPLQQIVEALASDLPAAVLVVIHQAQSTPGILPDLLSQSGPFVARYAEDGEAPVAGRIYIAPPDHHLLVEPNRLRLSRGPKENRFRPAIDPLFRSAGRAFGNRVIGVILSGLLDDGSLGMIRLKQFGGIAIAQNPAEATSPDMPASAIHHARIEHVLRSDRIGPLLNRLVAEPAPAEGSRAHVGVPAMSEQSRSEESRGPSGQEQDRALSGDAALTKGSMAGPPSAFTCPECGGAVWERADGKLVHYACHVGHTYTADSMAAAHDALLEATLWESLRMFEEKAALEKRISERAENQGQPDLATRYGERVRETRRRAEVIRQLLLGESSA